MTTVAYRSRPAVVSSLALDRAPYRSFLADTVIQHGPPAELGRLFLVADTQLREAGVRLSFATPEEFIAVNRANSDSWKPLVPLFDPKLNDLDARNSLALIGRSASGQPVVTVAARVYDLGSGSLADEVESLRLFYRDPAASAEPGEAARVTSTVARATTGKAVFSGGAWVHPAWRKKCLVDHAAPIVRALGLTSWMPDLTFSFMVRDLVDNGTARRWHMNVDWGVELINSPIKRGSTLETALSWTTPSRMLEHFEGYVSGHRPSVAREALQA